MSMNMEQPTKLVIDLIDTDDDTMRQIILLLMDAKEAEWSWEGWARVLGLKPTTRLRS